MKGKFNLKVLPLALAVALAACGGGGDDSKSARKPAAGGNQAQPVASNTAKLAEYQAANLLPTLGADFERKHNLKAYRAGDMIAGVQNDVADNINRMYPKPAQKAAAVQLARAIREAVELTFVATRGLNLLEYSVVANVPGYRDVIAGLRPQALVINEKIARAAFCVHERFGHQDYRPSHQNHEPTNVIRHIRAMSIDRPDYGSAYLAFSHALASGAGFVTVPAPHKGGYCEDGKKSASASLSATGSVMESTDQFASASLFFPANETAFMDVVYDGLYMADLEAARTRAENKRDFYLVKLELEKANALFKSAYQGFIEKRVEKRENPFPDILLHISLNGANDEWARLYNDAMPDYDALYKRLVEKYIAEASDEFVQYAKESANKTFDANKYAALKAEIEKRFLQKRTPPVFHSIGSGQLLLRRFYNMLLEQNILSAPGTGGNSKGEPSFVHEYLAVLSDPESWAKSPVIFTVDVEALMKAARDYFLHGVRFQGVISDQDQTTQAPPPMPGWMLGSTAEGRKLQEELRKKFEEEWRKQRGGFATYREKIDEEVRKLQEELRQRKEREKSGQG